jgi:hypothetical protein
MISDNVVVAAAPPIIATQLNAGIVIADSFAPIGITSVEIVIWMRLSPHAGALSTATLSSAYEVTLTWLALAGIVGSGVGTGDKLGAVEIVGASVVSDEQKPHAASHDPARGQVGHR